MLESPGVCINIFSKINMNNKTLALIIFSVSILISLKIFSISLKDQSQLVGVITSTSHLFLTALASYLILRRKDS